MLFNIKEFPNLHQIKLKIFLKAHLEGVKQSRIGLRVRFTLVDIVY